MALSSNLFVTNLFELVFFRAFLANLPYKSTYKIAILQFLPTYPLLRFIIFYKPNVYPYIYRLSQEEWTKLRESVPCVKMYRYNPKHLYQKLNGYGDNGQRSLKV